jgi:hypothetical protein
VIDATRLFQASVVRDEDGTLKRAYHGTRDNFDVSATRDGGAHLGTIDHAQARGSGNERRTVEAYLNIKKTRRARDTGSGWTTNVKGCEESRARSKRDHSGRTTHGRDQVRHDTQTVTSN